MASIDQGGFSAGHATAVAPIGSNRPKAAQPGRPSPSMPDKSPSRHRTPADSQTKAALIMVVIDDDVTRLALRQLLEMEGYRVVEADGGVRAIARMSNDIACVLLDPIMPDMSGLDCLRHIHKQFADIPVIMIADAGEIPEAVAALKEGAFEHLSKPWNREELLIRIRQGIRVARLAADNRNLRQAVNSPMPPLTLVGDSTAMKAVRKEIGTFAQLDSTVLITGAAGSGKTIAAQLIHVNGARAAGPFVSLNCGALPRDLLEDELFGHVRGAFAGASSDRPGRVEIADGGTLLLDEIGELPLELQPKLLSLLQEHTVQRIGSKSATRVDVRVIATTDHDLTSMCRQGRFREGLSFRLNVLPLSMPAVKDHPSDIPALTAEILGRIAQRRNYPPFILDADATSAMGWYEWPGNVREMENVLQRASARCKDGIIRRQDLMLNLQATATATGGNGGTELVGMTLSEIECRAIVQTLKHCGGNRAKTARQLGVSEKTIYNKIKQFNLVGTV